MRDIKARKRRYRHALTMSVYGRLSKRWPAAFPSVNRHGHVTSARPLKIGIYRDILEADHLDEIVGPGLTSTGQRLRVRFAIGWLTRSPAYLKARVVGAFRVDLDGNLAGVVQAEDLVPPVALPVSDTNAPCH